MVATFLFEIALLIFGLPMNGDLDSYSYHLMVNGSVIQVDLTEDGWGYDAVMYPLQAPEEALEMDVDFMDNALYNLVIPSIGTEMVFDVATYAMEMQWNQSAGDTHTFFVDGVGDMIQHFDGENHFIAAPEEGMVLVVHKRNLRND